MRATSWTNSQVPKEFPVFIKEKQEKKVNLEYDINNGAPRPEFDDNDGNNDDGHLGEFEAAEEEQPSEYGPDKISEPTVRPKQPPVHDVMKLHLAEFFFDDDGDGLAYGENYSHLYGNSVGDGIEGIFIAGVWLHFCSSGKDQCVGQVCSCPT